MATILIIEDDARVRSALARAMERCGHAVATAPTAMDGLRLAVAERPEVIVLDLGLPDVDGGDLLRMIRGVSRVPVIIATARDDEREIVRLLDAGADDYIVKPFAFTELFARVDAVCRRSGHRPSPVLTSGPVSLDLTNRRVTASGKHVDLTPTEFTILELLMRNAGQVTTRKALCEHVWEGDWDGVTNVIEVHINRLRNKLAQTGNDGMIQTVRGRGYSLRSGA